MTTGGSLALAKLNRTLGQIQDRGINCCKKENIKIIVVFYFSEKVTFISQLTTASL